MYGARARNCIHGCGWSRKCKVVVFSVRTQISCSWFNRTCYTEAGIRSYTKRKLPFNQICKVSKAQLGVTVSAVPQIWSCKQSCLFLLFFSPPWVVLGGIFFPQLPPHTLWPTSLTFFLLAHCFTSVWARASELHHCFIWIKLWSWGVIYLHSVCV